MARCAGAGCDAGSGSGEVEPTSEGEPTAESWADNYVPVGEGELNAAGEAGPSSRSKDGEARLDDGAHDGDWHGPGDAWRLTCSSPDAAWSS